MEQFIINEVSKYGYLAILLLMTLESACIPIPSEAIMLFGGALTAGVVIDKTATHLNIFLVILFGVVGNLLGAYISYVVGRTGGRTIFDKWGKYLLLKKHDLDKAETFFAKKGELAVLIGRLLPVIRTFISLPAGIAEMPTLKFGLFTILGSLPWAIAFAYTGRALANNWQSISQYSTPVSIVFALIIIAIFVYWYYQRKKKLTTKEPAST